jgi:hypothetical protein
MGLNKNYNLRDYLFFRPIRTAAREAKSMSVSNLSGIGVIVFALSLALYTPPTFGQAPDSWPVKNKLIGKKDKEGKKDKKSEDVSGIACTTEQNFSRSCLVIDDNLQNAQFVQLKEGELVAGSAVNLIDNKFGDELLELDGEGVAFSKGSYYVIGSHGHPRDKKRKLDPTRDADEIKARIAAASQIVRFRATAEGGAAAEPERTPNLKEIIDAEPKFDHFRDQRLESNGLTIEGIAIKDDATLFAGFRGPVLDGNKAVVLSVPIDALFRGTAQHRLFQLELGEGRGVRDLARFEAGLLILAGPSADGPGVYAVYAWDGESEKVERLAELTQFDPDRKPEGLLALDKSAAGLRVLIVFDGDEEGTPTPVTISVPKVPTR